MLGATTILCTFGAMKNFFRNSSLLLLSASLAYGGVPPISVTVSDAAGKAAFKGTTNASGGFTTSKLQPGKYIVQLNSRDGGAKGSQYTIVVSAGAKKVSASAVGGTKLASSGVALKVDLASALNITGQIAVETGPTTAGGKKMVWIPPQLGSNMPGHFAEEGSAEEVASRGHTVDSASMLGLGQRK